MTVGEIRDEVIKMLGNILAQAGHPFVASTDYPFLWITRACNKVPRLVTAGGADPLVSFPELAERWKIQTSDTVGWVARPSNALIIRTVTSFDMTGATADVDDEREVYEEKNPVIFNASGRGADSTGYPTSWCLQANRLHIKPTPRTPYLTDIHEYGIKRESAVFNDDDQTPLIAEDWHEAIVIASAAIGARALGYFERAKVYDGELAVLVRTGIEVVAQEDLFDDPSFSLGLVTDSIEDWGSIY